jgi:hypothetical protein
MNPAGSNKVATGGFGAAQAAREKVARCATSGVGEASDGALKTRERCSGVFRGAGMKRR